MSFVIVLTFRLPRSNVDLPKVYETRQSCEAHIASQIAGPKRDAARVKGTVTARCEGTYGN
jgi:hypothetical protein